MDKLVKEIRTSTWNRRGHLTSDHVAMSSFLYTSMTIRIAKMIQMNEKDLAKMREKNYKEEYIESMRITEDEIGKMLRRISHMVVSAASTNCIVKKPEHILSITVEKYYEPIGVIGIIADSKPIKAIETLAAIVQSGNGCIFYYSEDMANLMGLIIRLVEDARSEFNCIRNIASFSDKEMSAKMISTNLFDLVIPIGSNQFCKFVTENARSRVVKINDGPTHIFVCNDAPEKFMYNVCLDSKLTDYTSPIAVSTLLIQSGRVQYLDYIVEKYRQNGITIYGCEEMCKLYNVLPATHENYATQYQSKAINIRIVKSMNEAVNHINLYSSGCVDGIISIEQRNLRVFSFMIASSCVAQNISTLACDGETLNYSYELFYGSKEQWFHGPISIDDLLRERRIVSGNGLEKYPRDKIIEFKMQQIQLKANKK